MRLPVLILAGFLLAADAGPSVSYFTNMRSVQPQPARSQNFLVIDDAVWAHARPDLSDLRLFDGQTQVPYALREQRAGVASVEREAKVLNLGTLAGHTEFDLDLSASDVEDYNRIQLEMTAKNFVAVATVEGKNDVNGKQGARLGSSTLYDFTRENLGSNATLTVPLSSFRYLHVRLGAGVSSTQVTGARVSRFAEKAAIWKEAGSCQQAASQPRTTSFTCIAEGTVPVERVAFQIPADRVNFRRGVMVKRSDGNDVGSGSISRVRITRAGQAVVTEELGVDLPSAHSKQFTVTIENGDDVPLPIERVQLLSVQRRVYFNPEGKSALTLYYGDLKLGPPTYDYEQFFREEGTAVEASLGPDQLNAAYKGRPDDRPWSEQHKILLWLAMTLVVIALLAVTVHGFRSETPPTSPE